MTINEFIDFIRINNISGDTQIMIDGYEGGITDIKTVRKEKVELGYHKDCTTYGEHELVRDTFHNPESVTGLLVDCVYISRFDRRNI